MAGRNWLGECSRGKMELRAELTGRDGQKSQLRVRCEPREEQLRGLVSGLAQLREQVSALLAPLVQQESGAGDQAGLGGDEEADEGEDDDEENHVNANTGQDSPPFKRTKT